MPSEQSVPTQPQPEDLDLSREQIKVCIVCKTPVSSADVDYPAHQLLCAGCREPRSAPNRQQYPISAGGRGSFGGAEFVRPVLMQSPPDGPSPIPFPTSQTHPSTSPLDVPDLLRSVSTSSESGSYLSRISDKIHHAPKIKIQTDNLYPVSRTVSSESVQSQKEARQETIHSPNPLVDITRIRVRSPTHHCLYPGATFTGTQKSGRSSYDVNVTIVVRVSLPLSWSPQSNQPLPTGCRLLVIVFVWLSTDTRPNRGLARAHNLL
jgi:glucose-induced degradation protein 4